MKRLFADISIHVASAFDASRLWPAGSSRLVIKVLLCVIIAALLFEPATVLGCAVCYGQSDAPMARGMNWGILSLLGVVVTVLGGIAGFFIYLAKRSAGS